MILPIIVRACPVEPVPERGFAPVGGETALVRAWAGVTATRLRRLPRRRVCGRAVPIATGLRSRLLGLAGLDEGAAGAGLLIPRCAGVHTFGMRFALDLVFLDGQERPLALRAGVPPRRFVHECGARAVLELPAGQGGEFCSSLA
jgi:uncharacterized membrane protein (UPF0127 family)